MTNVHESDIRYGRGFGRGTLIGDGNDKFFYPPYSTTPAFRAIDLAWSNGCPRALSLINKNPEWIMDRYAETNFWFGYILTVLKELNSPLYNQLENPTYRKSNEPIGHHELQSVPRSHETQISPMSGLYGYALPRVLIEIIGRGEDRSKTKMLIALETLEHSIANSQTPAEFLAKLSNEALSNNVDPKMVLHHILPKSILDEENCWHTFREFFYQLRQLSPALLTLYKLMSPEKRNELELIPEIPG